MTFEVEYKPGPNGREGGVPFPEAQEEIDRMMGSGGPPRWLLKLLPKRLLIGRMRKMMGFANRDIAGDRVTTTHASIQCPDREIPIRVYTPEGRDLPIVLFYHGGG